MHGIGLSAARVVSRSQTMDTIDYRQCVANIGSLVLWHAAMMIITLILSFNIKTINILSKKNNLPLFIHNAKIILKINKFVEQTIEWLFNNYKKCKRTKTETEGDTCKHLHSPRLACQTILSVLYQMVSVVS